MSAALDQSLLAQLAAELSERHAGGEAALPDAIGHAMRAGGLRIEAKGLVAPDEWLSPSGARTAQASVI